MVTPLFCFCLFCFYFLKNKSFCFVCLILFACFHCYACLFVGCFLFVIFFVLVSVCSFNCFYLFIMLYSYASYSLFSHIHSFIHSFHPFTHKQWKLDSHGQDAEVKYADEPMLSGTGR